MASPAPEPRHDGLSTLQVVRDAMVDYYRLLCRMPHIQPGALRMPPANGWPDVGDAALLSRGKTREALDFLRHLPCLVHGPGADHPNIAQHSRAIPFCDGEAIEEWQEKMLQTPGHVIWIGDGTSEDGDYLLLDTVNGTITEWSPVDNTCRLEYEEYEALPQSDKWMAHSTYPAQAWFQREYQRIKKLVYLPVLPRPGHGEVQFWSRVASPAEEEDLLAGDEDDADFNEAQTEVESSDDEGTSDDADGLDDSMSEEITPEELESLRMEDDIPGDFTPEPKPDVAPARPLPSSAGKISDVRRQKLTALYNIYQRNGWPAESFDQDKCRQELIQWQLDQWEAGRAAREAKDKQRSEQLRADHERRERIKRERAAAAPSE